jgi:predicted MFS family arabinose efflux permease
VLFAGLLVAGASAGLVFPPFSDIVSDSLEPAARGRVLAAISAGTGWGVALAAPIALLAGDSWRVAWALFAGVAALATIWALTVLPSAGGAERHGEIVRIRLGWFVCPRSRPLLTGSLLVGLASSVYWTFAVDHVHSEGGLTSMGSRLFLAVVGLASVAGSLSAHAIDRLGARATFILAAATEAAALVLLGFAPGHLEADFASAVLFGAAYNCVVAVAVIWSSHVFAGRPSAGLAAIMVMQAVGLLTGPPLLGAVADRTGVPTIFALAAALLLLATAFAPREALRYGSTANCGAPSFDQ